MLVSDDLIVVFYALRELFAKPESWWLGPVVQGGTSKQTVNRRVYTMAGHHEAQVRRRAERHVAAPAPRLPADPSAFMGSAFLPACVSAGHACDDGGRAEHGGEHAAAALAQLQHLLGVRRSRRPRLLHLRGQGPARRPAARARQAGPTAGRGARAGDSRGLPHVTHQQGR